MKDWLKAAIPSVSAAIIAAVVASVGVWVSYQTYKSTSEDRAAQRAATRSDRFAKAIEYLNDDSLAIRIAALYELQNLGLEDEKYQERIVRVLGPFIFDGIEDSPKRQPENHESIEKNMRRAENWPQDIIYPERLPLDDIFLACEITSLFWEQTGHEISLRFLKADDIDLSGIKLKGADLRDADLRDSCLIDASFHGAYLLRVKFDNAIFGWTDIRGAELTDSNIYEVIGIIDDGPNVVIFDEDTFPEPPPSAFVEYHLRAIYERELAE